MPLHLATVPPRLVVIVPGLALARRLRQELCQLEASFGAVPVQLTTRLEDVARWPSTPILWVGEPQACPLGLCASPLLVASEAEATNRVRQILVASEVRDRVAERGEYFIVHRSGMVEVGAGAAAQLEVRGAPPDLSQIVEFGEFLGSFAAAAPLNRLAALVRDRESPPDAYIERFAVTRGRASRRLRLRLVVDPLSPPAGSPTFVGLLDAAQSRSSTVGTGHTSWIPVATPLREERRAPRPHARLRHHLERALAEAEGGPASVKKAIEVGLAGLDLIERTPPSSRRRAAERLPKPSVSPSGVVSSHRTVLLVDDEPAVGRSLRRLLKHHGWRAEVFTDPREALAAVQAHATRYQAIISDVMMPHLSGPEFASAVAEVAPELGLKVVFITGGVLDTGVEEALVRSEKTVLRKPTDTQALVASLERFSPRAAAHGNSY
ncbi:MAG: response regulator [Myxococcota bacterium]